MKLNTLVALIEMLKEHCFGFITGNNVHYSFKDVCSFDPSQCQQPLLRVVPVELEERICVYKLSVRPQVEGFHGDDLQTVCAVR